MNRLRNLIVRVLMRRFKVLRDIGRLAFRKYGNRTFLIAPGGEFTYSETENRVLRLGAALESAGAGKGAAVLAVLRDDHERIEVALATLETGSVLTQLNVPIELDRIRTVVDTVRPRLVIADQDLPPEVFVVIGESAPDAIVWRTGDEYEGKLSRHEARQSSSRLSPDDVVAVGFTSGTTGPPKAVATRPRRALASMRMIVKHVGVGKPAAEPEVLVVGVPLAGAGSGTIFPTLLSGGVLVIPESYSAAVIAAAIEKHRAQRTFVTPSMLIDLLDLPEDQHQLGSLTNIIYGSEQTPAAKLEEAIARFGPILQQGYGSAEVLPPLAMLQPADHVVGNRPAPRDVLTSVGVVVSDVELRIVDDAGDSVPTGTIGTIEVRSPTVFEGYVDRPDLTAAAFRDGWYRIGDVGFLGDGRRLHVLGRSADVIVRAGETMYPRFVEEEAHDHPAVKEAACVQVHDEAVLAVSLRRAFKNAEPDVVAKELMALLETRLPAERIPDRVEILEELPRSILAKVLRRDVRAKLAGQVTE